MIHLETTTHPRLFTTDTVAAGLGYCGRRTISKAVSGGSLDNIPLRLQPYMRSKFVVPGDRSRRGIYAFSALDVWMWQIKNSRPVKGIPRGMDAGVAWFEDRLDAAATGLNQAILDEMFFESPPYGRLVRQPIPILKGTSHA